MIEVESNTGETIQVGIYSIRWVRNHKEGGGSVITFMDDKILSIKEDAATVRHKVNKAHGG